MPEPDHEHHAQQWAGHGTCQLLIVGHVDPQEILRALHQILFLREKIALALLNNREH
jgi:hypothetical protein